MNIFKRIKLFFFPTEEWKQYRKTLKDARKEYPKGTAMRMMHIHNYVHYSGMAKREEDMFEMYASEDEKRREKVRKQVIAKSSAKSIDHDTVY